MINKTKVRLHNKFDVVIEDTITGEKTTLSTENVVLNQMYTQLAANNQNLTAYIWIGTGSGTPAATDTSLFRQLTYKGATVESHGQASGGNLTRYKRQYILLDTADYVGQTITEVGIGSSSYLLTHAMLKDALGSNIGILKTDTMRLYIYATIYASIPDKPEGFTYYDSPENSLLHRLIGTGTYSGKMGTSDVPAELYSKLIPNTARMSMNKALTESYSNYERSYTTRLQVSEANGIDIRTVVLDGVGAVDLSKVMEPISIENAKIIPESDMQTCIFSKHIPMEGSIVVKKNGIAVPTSDYDIIDYKAQFKKANVQLQPNVLFNLPAETIVQNGGKYHTLKRNSATSIDYVVMDGDGNVETTIPLKGLPRSYDSISYAILSPELDFVFLYYNTASQYYAWRGILYNFDKVSGQLTQKADDFGRSNITYGEVYAIAAKGGGFAIGEVYDSNATSGGLYNNSNDNISGPYSVVECGDELGWINNYFYTVNDAEYLQLLSEDGKSITAKYDKHYVEPLTKLRIETDGSLYLDYYESTEGDVINTIKILFKISSTAAADPNCYKACYAQRIGKNYLRLVAPTGDTAVVNNTAAYWGVIDFDKKEVYMCHLPHGGASVLARRVTNGMLLHGEKDAITMSHGTSILSRCLVTIEPVKSAIKFKAPVAAEDLITVDYKLDYVPKDENWVVDYTHVIKYGDA